jgi:hypothetical protein
MNERIKNLANIWANRRAEDEKLGITYTFSEPALERFTEMIVKKCAGKVDWILAEGGKTQGDLIKEYFGVEE